MDPSPPEDRSSSQATERFRIEDLTAGRAQDPGAALVFLILEPSGSSRVQALSHLASTLRGEMADPAWPRPGHDSLLLQVLRAQRGLLQGARERLHAELKAMAQVLVPAVSRLLPGRTGQDLHLLLELARSLASPDLNPALLPYLDSADRFAAIQALSAIAANRTGDSVGVLLKALERPDLRWAAVGLLADQRVPEAIQPLARLLQDPSAEIRREAVRAIFTYEDPRTLPWFRAVCERDPDIQVREAARDAIRRISVRHGLPVDDTEILKACLAAVKTERALDRILLSARLAGASDVHLMTGTPIGMRIHGVLTEPEPARVLSAGEVADLVRPIIPNRIAPVFDRELQADFSYVVPGIGRHRVNVFMERRGLAAVIRLIPPEIPGIAALGLPPQVKDVVSFQQGLFLVTGRSGSGKTTTLAALVNLLNESRPVHIITLEDPIEYLHLRKRGLVSQREVGRHSLSFPAALRAALREDPDVIVVGEMRDLTTIRLAVEAAETGHLVLATLHTPDTIGAVARLIEAFPVSEQQQVRLLLADSLKMVLAQSLIRDRSGQGRVGCFELLVCNAAVSNLIRENKINQIPSLLQTGRSQGMKSFDAALMELVQAQRIEPEEAFLHALNKDLFRPMLKSHQMEGNPGGP